MLGKKKWPANTDPVLASTASPGIQTVSSQVPTLQTANTGSKQGSDPPVDVATSTATPTKESLLINFGVDFSKDRLISPPPPASQNLIIIPPKRMQHLH